MKDLWEQQAANELKAEIKRSGFAYADLAAKLSAQDMPMTAHGLAKKLHRGAFSYAFFLRCLVILESARQELHPQSLVARTRRAAGREEDMDVRDLPVRSG